MAPPGIGQINPPPSDFPDYPYRHPDNLVVAGAPLLNRTQIAPVYGRHFAQRKVSAGKARVSVAAFPELSFPRFCKMEDTF